MVAVETWGANANEPGLAKFGRTNVAETSPILDPWKKWKNVQSVLNILYKIDEHINWFR